MATKDQLKTVAHAKLDEMINELWRDGDDTFDVDLHRYGPDTDEKPVGDYAGLAAQLVVTTEDTYDCDDEWLYNACIITLDPETGQPVRHITEK